MCKYESMYNPRLDSKKFARIIVCNSLRLIEYISGCVGYYVAAYFSVIGIEVLFQGTVDRIFFFIILASVLYTIRIK